MSTPAKKADDQEEAPENTEPLSILQRLNEVRKAVKYIQKKKSVEGYKAVEHDEVTAVIREHLVTHGVFVVPQLVYSRVTPTGTQTKNGTPIIRYEGRYQVDFINMDEPDDKYTMTVEAHANDHGDKAPGKAASYATKTAELKVLTLETGESDESRYQTVDVETVSDEQLSELRDLVAEWEPDEDKKAAMLDYFKLGDLEELAASRFPEAKKILQSKIKAKNK